MMRDRITSKQRLGETVYSWGEISTMVMVLILLAMFAYLTFIVLNGAH